ncbi:MAG: hypothetical protein DHS20C11_25280 [Lysobacteraceae bacterium]|nr:MAG: hypothetical protein DHS20C11_25280 [Xanthomonadaceae bacterium]
MGQDKERDVENDLERLLADADEMSTDQLAASADLPQPDLSALDHPQVEIGARFGHWQVVGVLGQGGMATVYRVRRADQQVDQTAALKLLPAAIHEGPLHQRFVRERQILADLHHPNIASLLDAGITEEGQPWFVMELVSGSSVTKWCQSMALDVEGRLQLIRQVCAALAYAHGKGVVHRDIKPSNILVDQDSGVAKLLDFGIATLDTDTSLTMTGTVMGTPGYMSPEQARGQHQSLDRRSDVFSLGVVIYQLLSDAMPFEGDSAVEITYRIINEDPAPLPGTVARDLRAITEKCLAKAPDDRYASANALERDLLAYLNGESVSARALNTRQRAWRKVRKHPVVSGLLALALVAVIAAGGVAVWQSVAALKRVAAAERYIYQAQDIQHQVRRVHMMPAHDISEDYAQIKQRIDQLRQQLAADVEASKGPGHFALGSALMTMREFEPARIEFEAALDAGWSSPELLMAYGYTLLIAWDDAKSAARSLADADDRADAEAQAMIDFHDPAIAALEAARDKVALAEFLEARLAYIELDYERAIEYAERSIAANPWHYESLRLAAEVSMKKFTAEGNKAGYAAVLPVFERGLEFLDRALDIGRSDPYLYISRCTNGSVQVQLYRQLRQDDKLLGAVDQVLAYCNEAIRLKEDAYSPWVNLNLIYNTKGDWQAANDLDPLPTYRAALDAAQRSVALYPESKSTLNATVKPLVKLAEAEADEGGDPMPLYAQARDYIERSLVVDREHDDVWAERGRLSWSIALYHRESGELNLAVDAYHQTIESYLQAHQYSGSSGSAANTGRAAIELAELHQELNDPGAALQRLTQAVDTWLPAIPSRAPYFGYLGEVVDAAFRVLSFEHVLETTITAQVGQLQAAIAKGCEMASGDADRLGQVESWQSRLLAMGHAEQRPSCGIEDE